MPKLAPIEEVRQRFGSKAELVKELLPVLERDDVDIDVDVEEWERRINSMSNKKLLRLHRTNEVVSSRFGSKERLVEAIVKLRFPDGNVPYADKLRGLRTTRLLDLYGTRL